MSKIKNKNSRISNIAIIMASLLILFLSQLTMTSIFTLNLTAYATNQTPIYNDNHNSDDSHLKINNKPTSEHEIVCATPVTTCPPPTGGNSGAII